MSEKSHNPAESASNPNAEKQKRARAILRELNQIRRDHGQPDIIIIGDTDKETALDEDREAELAKDRENDLQKDREVDLARGVNVREIASDQDGATKKEVVADMAAKLQEEINRASVEALPEEKAKELAEKIDDPNFTEDKIAEFIQNSGVDIAKIIEETKNRFREFYLKGEEK